MRFGLAVSLFLAACGGSPKSAAMPEAPTPPPANETASPTEAAPAPTEATEGGGAGGAPAEKMSAPAPGATPTPPTPPKTRGAVKKGSELTGDPCAVGE
jgi:hypothetical protein